MSLREDEIQALVDTALDEPLDHYNHALAVMPRSDFSGPGDPDGARVHLEKALALMERFSPQVQAHPTYIYWHEEVLAQLALLPQENEVDR